MIKFLTAVLCVILCCSMNGQDYLLKKVEGKYFHNGKVYKKKELGQLYSAYPDILETYNAARKNSKISVATGLVGLGGIIGGVAFARSGDLNDLDHLILVALIVGGGVLLGIISIAEIATSKENYKKAMNQFNFEMIEKHGYQEKSSLQIGTTSHGVGLVYQF